jgi:hypothetical protein
MGLRGTEEAIDVDVDPGVSVGASARTAEKLPLGLGGGESPVPSHGAASLGVSGERGLVLELIETVIEELEVLRAPH